MRVGLLGPLEVEADGKTVHIRGIRLRALLIRLALDPGRVVSVSTLTRAVWPQGGPVDPANALQTLVSRFRRTFPQDPAALRWTSGGYCLDLPPHAVDFLRFEDLARTGQRLLGSGRPRAAAQDLREALALWRGEALADAEELPFAVETAARLRELRISAVEDRTEAVLTGGLVTEPENCGLVAELEEHVTAHPLRERLRSLLVRVLCAHGRNAEALGVCEEFRRLLAAELGTDPGPQMRAAHLAALNVPRSRPRARGAGDTGGAEDAGCAEDAGRAEDAGCAEGAGDAWGSEHSGDAEGGGGADTEGAADSGAGSVASAHGERTPHRPRAGHGHRAPAHGRDGHGNGHEGHGNEHGTNGNGHGTLANGQGRTRGHGHGHEHSHGPAHGHMSSHGGTAGAGPGPRRPGAPRTPLTSFVGRTEKLTLLREQLTESRLVTLIGPGGAGKTRLATACVTEVAESFPGGAVLVELAATTDPADVPQSVATALGLRGSGLPTVAGTTPDLMSGLVETLSAAGTLLVLDNCEHLVASVAGLADALLTQCPELRVLATSREPLGILGEALCPIPPLAVPEPSASWTSTAASPSVQLFTDRATAVQPDFRLTEENAPLVAEICRRLDGLPLAIELAAARLRSLPVGLMASRLDRRFQLLTRGNRTALPRHRTLRAVVDWSWHLLGEDQRSFLQRLAVFPASITPESAAAVCARGGDDGHGDDGSIEVLDTLSALVDKSLLQVVHGPETRYRMLETIRAYALERLAEEGGTEEARAAHTTCFLHLAERATLLLHGPAQLAPMRCLAAERDNLVAALNHACESGDVGTAVRLGAALGSFWTVRGNHAEAATRLRLPLDMPGAAQHPAWPTAAAFCLLNAVLCGESAPSHLASVIAVARARPRREEYDPMAEVAEAAIALLTGDESTDTAPVDAPAADLDPWLRGVVNLLRAFLRGQFDGMDSGYDGLITAVEDFRASGERWGQATALSFLAFMRSNLGEMDEAVGDLEEALTLLRDMDTSDDAPLQRIWLAEMRARQGDPARARSELRRLVTGEAAGAGAGAPRPTSHIILARVALGEQHRLAGELRCAEEQFDAAEAGIERLPSPFLACRAILESARAHLLLAVGDQEAARRCLRAAVTLAVRLSHHTVVAMAGVALAELHARRGQPKLAAETLGAAHMLRGAPDSGNPDVIRLARALRGELGAEVYAEAYACGRDLERSQAVRLLETELPTAG